MKKMKKKSVLKFYERLIFSCFLLVEQFLGKKLFNLLLPIKMSFLEKVYLRLSLIGSPDIFSIDKRNELSPDEFHQNYFNESLPVVFAGAASDWDCTKKWNLDYFKFGFGDQDVLLVNATGLTSRENNTNYEFLTVKELIEDIKSGGNKYLRFSPILENNPILVEDLNMNWLEKMRGQQTFAHTYYMFMGGAGKKTLLHTDQPCNIYVQIFGEKKWTLFFPEDTALIYPEIANTAYIKSPIDVDHPNLDKYPLYKYATPIEVILKPGDVLYVPPHTWHFVENLSDSIAIGYRFSSLSAALKSSFTLSILRILSTNPPIWKSIKYGKIDTNLIWAHAGGKIKDLIKDLDLRKKLRNKNEL